MQQNHRVEVRGLVGSPEVRVEMKDQSWQGVKGRLYELNAFVGQLKGAQYRKEKQTKKHSRSSGSDA